MSPERRVFGIENGRTNIRGMKPTIFNKQEPLQEMLIEYYEDYWDKRKQFVSEKRTALIKQFVKPGNVVLDFGCGKQVYEPVVEKVKAFYVGIDIQDIIPAGKRFDIILLFEVLEHLFFPEETVRLCSEQLKEEGYILVTAPNAAWIVDRMLLLFGRFNPRGRRRGEQKEVWEDPHIRFFTPKTLQALMRKYLEKVYFKGNMFRPYMYGVWKKQERLYRKSNK